eukprot:jgi/Picsp_1/167/NSC_00167-R1_protein
MMRRAASLIVPLGERWASSGPGLDVMSCLTISISKMNMTIGTTGSVAGQAANQNPLGTASVAFYSGDSSLAEHSSTSDAANGKESKIIVENRSPAAPWTPTRMLEKRKTLPKRMGYMLTVLEKEKEEEAMKNKGFPPFRPGDMIELKLSIPQNKGRETTFKGICISKRNRGWRTSFTLRNFIGNSGGIERSFPLYSPHIIDLKLIETQKKKKYRRSKLYYLRNVQPKAYRIA